MKIFKALIILAILVIQVGCSSNTSRYNQDNIDVIEIKTDFMIKVFTDVDQIRETLSLLNTIEFSSNADIKNDQHVYEFVLSNKFNKNKNSLYFNGALVLSYNKWYMMNTYSIVNVYPELFMVM